MIRRIWGALVMARAFLGIGEDMPKLADLCYGFEDSVEFVAVAATGAKSLRGVRACGGEAGEASGEFAYIGTADEAGALIEAWDGMTILNLVVSDCADGSAFAGRPNLNLATSALSFAELLNRMLENFELFSALRNQLEFVRIGYDSLGRLSAAINAILEPRANVYVLNASFAPIDQKTMGTGGRQSIASDGAAAQSNFFLERLSAGSSANIQIVPVQIDKAVLGYLMIEEHSGRQMPEGFIELLAHYVSMHIGDAGEGFASEKNEVEALLSDLLSNTEEDGEVLLGRLKRLPYRIDRFLRLMIVSSDSPNLMAKPEFTKGLRKVFPNCNMAPYDKFYVVLIPEEGDFLRHFEFDEREFNALLEKYDARAVFSRTAQSALGIRTVYLQSRDIYDMALPEKLTNGNRFAFFSDVSDYYRAFLCASAMSKYNGHEYLRFLTNPIISLILKYDKSNNGNLFEVLVNYLENDCNVSKTAEVMHFHRNTIINKVNQIRHLFKIDFDDSKMKMDLFASCQIARYAMHVSQVKANDNPFLA